MSSDRGEAHSIGMQYCTLEWSLPDFLRSITVHIVFDLPLEAPKPVFARGSFYSGIRSSLWLRVVNGLEFCRWTETGRDRIKEPGFQVSFVVIPDQFSLLFRVSFNRINKEPSTMCSWWKWWISVASCEESIVLRVGFSRSIDSIFSETKFSGDDYEHCVSSVPKALIGYRRGPAANANDQWVSARM